MFYIGIIYVLYRNYFKTKYTTYHIKEQINGLLSVWNFLIISFHELVACKRLICIVLFVYCQCINHFKISQL